MPDRERFLQAVDAHRKIPLNTATHIMQRLRQMNGKGTWVMVTDEFQLDGYTVQGIQHTESGAVRALYAKGPEWHVQFFERPG